MLDYDALEAAGHELTLVGGPAAGVSTYWCENCGAIIIGITARGDDENLFHAPRFSVATETHCTTVLVLARGKSGPSLREKLQQRHIDWCRRHAERDLL